MLKKQMARFLICGGSAALTDFAAYYLFLQFMTYSPAKALSFVCGAVVAYFANKHFTFEQPNRNYGEAARFTVLYITTFGVNVGSNKAALMVLGDYTLVCFVIATGLTTVCNFIGQKFFVFRK